MAQEARISQNKDIFKLVSQELNLVPTEKDLITACKGLYIQYSGLENWVADQLKVVSKFRM